MCLGASKFLIATFAHSEFGSTDSKQRTTQISNRNRFRLRANSPDRRPPGSLHSRLRIPKMKEQGADTARQRNSNRGSAIRIRSKPFELRRFEISNRLKTTPPGLKKRIRIERSRSR